MAYRISLIQQRFRVRKQLLAKLRREAEHNDRSVNDEIVRRLEESFAYGDWQAERRNVIAAVVDDLWSHPNPVATKAALDGSRESA
jgi:hypothetical protein